MNERIKKLNLQAMSIVMNGNDPDGDVDKMYVPSEFTEKFAELLIRECAKRVDYWESRQGEHTDDILKHFGVDK